MTANQLQQTGAGRLDGIQMLRGAAALAVVLFHFFIIEAIYDTDQGMAGFVGYGRAGVDLFFVISGFIMVHVTRNAPPGEASAGQFLFRRLQRIYPPYWIITFGMVALWTISHGAAFSTLVATHRNFLETFLLWPEGRDPVLNVGWTLVHEVYFYLIFTLVLFAPQRWRPALLGAWGAAMTAVHFSPLHDLSPATVLISHPMNLEFLFGACVAWARPHAGIKSHKAAMFTAALFLIGAVVYFGGAPTDAEFNQYWARTLLFGPLAACLVFVFAHPQTPVAPLLKSLGDRSYALYLLHIPLFAVLGVVWRKVSGPGYLDNVVAFAIMISA
ncbi:MAG: acyltransferase, partial [Caulobacterales bacterium]